METDASDYIAWLDSMWLQRLVEAGDRKPELSIGILLWPGFPLLSLTGLIESLRHAGVYHGVNVEIELIQAEHVPELLREGRLNSLDAMVIPGGFGERGIDGKIAAVEAL